MQPPKSSTPGPSTEPASEPRKNWREAALTSTPIVLTVLATALAGLSSSEMTQAQYHRSLAAQNQSKASDQWGFFQAKRSRATSERATADVLLGLADVNMIGASEVGPSLDRLLEKLRRAESDAQRLSQRVGAAKGALAESHASLPKQAEQHLQTVK